MALARGANARQRESGNHRHIDGILYVAGRAPVENQSEYDIMFIAGAVDEDEATQHSVTTFGFRINQPAEYLKGATGIIKDVALRAGIDLDKCYYTAVCKWLLPRMKRAKPPVKILKWGLPILMDEIKRTNCEWHGKTSVDGQLRTIQFAWTESDAVVIEFRNEQNEWSFDHSPEMIDDSIWLRSADQVAAEKDKVASI